MDKPRITIKGQIISDHNLQEWYDEYIATDGDSLSLDSKLIRCVDDDALDNETFEKQVARFAAHITDGFCLQCQTLFDNWPDFENVPASDLDSTVDAEAYQKGWEHHLSTRHFQVYELEASTRQGCRFCALIRQILIDSETLETYRKIEQRLGHFIKDLRITLSIQNWGSFSRTQSQLLWPNLPGKVCKSCNSGVALINQVQSIVTSIPGT